MSEGRPQRLSSKAPCHCGSGTKYKSCCSRKDAQARASSPRPEAEQYIFQADINAYSYLRKDAGDFVEAAKAAVGKQEERLYSRTALILIVAAVEGLANRLLDGSDAKCRLVLSQVEIGLTLETKCLLVAPVCSESGLNFDKSAYPWNKWCELIKVRNEMVHPKANRKAFHVYDDTVGNTHNFSPLNPKAIPGGLTTEKDLMWPQTQIPKNPKAIRFGHAESALKVADDLVAELDRIMGGGHLKEFHSEHYRLVHPPGATLETMKLRRR